MSGKNVRLLMAAILVGGSALLAAAQTSPPERTVTYHIRETPADPNSPVLIVIKCTVEQRAISATSCGWKVTSIAFAEQSGALRSWVADAPTVQSADGLWWVDHANPSQPSYAEFDALPTVTGFAVADEPAHGDLDFALKGAAIDPNDGAPFAVTSVLDYTLTLETSLEPIAIGIDEPSELPPPQEQPPI